MLVVSPANYNTDQITLSAAEKWQQWSDLWADPISPSDLSMAKTSNERCRSLETVGSDFVRPLVGNCAVMMEKERSEKL